ncbi:IclR family transcriptional regulator [Primorskyibacter sp. 2E107]|uniref:IclR family transcriptional regulator n=1 Tax=Primorskyibacter sp. 2E107 TaxID=3403458 RepID=UPI003AF88F9C
MVGTTREDSGKGGIQVIERAAKILRALKHDRAGMSLGQIAEAVELPRSTVQRIVAALMAERLLAAGSRAGRIRLGPEITALAEQSRNSVIETCRLVLSELSQATGETADLSVLRGGAMLFLDQIPGTHRLRTVSAVGDAFPLTTTANGLACLAEMEEGEALDLAREEWQRKGLQRDEAEFLGQLAEIRATGLAYDLDAHTDGISAVGVAVRDWSGGLYGISVPVPSARFEEVRPTVEAAVRRARDHAGKLLSSS